MKRNKISLVFLIITGVLTVGICAVMNFYLIPAIESGTGGLRIFDMNSFGYTYEQAKSFTAALSDSGLDMYLHRQLPLDFFYPVAYTAFFVLCLIKLKSQKGLLALPTVLALCDYGENICSIRMLTTDFTKAVANAGCVFTVCKSAVMCVVIALIVVLLVLKLIKRRKSVDNL